MARIERVDSVQPIPVQQAQLVDPADFQLSKASAEALKVAGAAVGKFGEVLTELRKRKEEMQDRLGVSNINAAMKNAEREYEKDLVQGIDVGQGRFVPIPFDERAQRLQKHIKDAMAESASQKLSPEARELADNKLAIWEGKVTDDAEIDIITAMGKDAVIILSSDYEEALTNGTRIDIAETGMALDEQLAISMTPAEAEVFKEKIEDRAVVQMKEDAKNDIMNRTAVRPGLIKSAIEVELKERAKGRKGLDEFALLTNTDLEAVKDYAGSVGEKAKSDSVIAVNTAVENSYARIIGGDIDTDLMISEIQTNPNITDEDSVKAADKILTFFSKHHSAKVADESNEPVYDELTRASEAVERGAMSPAAFEELYVDKKHLLTGKDQRSIRSKDIVATKTMQNRAFSDAISDTLSTFVEVTESELGAIKLARQNAEVIKDLERVNFFNIAIKKNQAQRWNFARFRKELRSQISQNPEWSQKQIFTAQEILTEQLDIPDGELLKQFDTQNPKRAIMKTPPDIRFKDIWPDLSIDDKALIWSERMAGTPVEVLLESEEVIEAQSTRRPNGTKKGVGFLGGLSLPGGGVATEFSIGTTDVTGKEMNIPTLVPTLTQKEIELMVNDIIPNKKKVPDAIFKKAVAHAKKRIKQGKSVFFEQGE
jgi:hypothetical protein